jgi:hypothetical protein
LKMSIEVRYSARLAVEVGPHTQPGYGDPWTVLTALRGR